MKTSQWRSYPISACKSDTLVMTLCDFFYWLRVSGLRVLWTNVFIWCVQDAEIIVEYRPLEDTVDPSNMLCAGKVCLTTDANLPQDNRDVWNDIIIIKVFEHKLDPPVWELFHHVSLSVTKHAQFSSDALLTPVMICNLNCLYSYYSFLCKLFVSL